MPDFASLNWLAILVATVAGFMIGGVWYGPLFGKAWMAAIGKTEDDIQPTPTPFIISFITSAITAIALAALMPAAGVVGAANGALFGLVIGIAFIATAMASDSAFCGWGTKLWAIQAGYRVTYTVVMGAILAAWT